MNESSQTEPAEKKEGIITQRVKALDERVKALEFAPRPFTKSSPDAANLLVVLSYHTGDAVQVVKLLKWIAELSPVPAGASWNFQLLLVADSAVPRETVGEIHNLAKLAFVRARTIIATLSKKGWPSGCDAAFLWACRYLKDNYKLPFLWLEPDCIPLKENWLTEIADAYERSAYRFLGAVIEQTGQKDMPAKFLAGCAVYPNHAFDIYNALPSVVNGAAAWDIAGGVNVAEGSENTKLIQHFWGSASDKPPIFVKQKSPDSPENHVMLDFLSQDAVLFHRSKDGKLIDLLREQRNGGSVGQSSQPAPGPAEHLD